LILNKWCSCIDGALTKENYIDSIKKAGFRNPEILEEKLYLQEVDQADSRRRRRRISSVVVKAVKD
jgi:arsenite methyltransferase